MQRQWPDDQLRATKSRYTVVLRRVVTTRAECGGEVEGASLSAESRGDTMIIAVSGDLDIVTSPQLDERLTQAEADHSAIILDFGEVTFLDTSALAVIVGHWKTAEARGRTLALANARYRYTKTLWITGLADKLTLYDTVDDGLAALARSAGTADG